ncbi:MAG: HEAT repeat domain-containing protein [Planctomycetes bacterium]|nr:HEAT repeat domain-containing protein [Planctomycetota bacterium]
MRTVLPAVVILVLLGLVILLPKRGDRGGDVPYLLPGSAAVGQEVAAALLGLPAPELEEPPEWALQRGDDEVQRWLDRLSWGGHESLVETREALLTHRGQLAHEVVARIQALGSTDPIQTSKLVAVLGQEDGHDPQVVETLTRLAYSDSDLVTKAALRALTGIDSPGALGALLDRRKDDDLDVRAYARSGLGHRARAGDTEALSYVIQDLSESAADPDLVYITVLGETEIPPEGYEVLRRIVEQAGYEASLTATSSLLAHGDPDAIQRCSEMIADRDLIVRLNGLRMAQLAGTVAGVDSWDELARHGSYQEVAALLGILDRAIRTGHDEALHASNLIEEIAGDPTRGAQSEAIGVLLSEGHPWAVERCRLELSDGVGVYLARTIDRVLRVKDVPLDGLGEVVHRRLTDEPGLGEVEQHALLQVLTKLDPTAALDLLDERVRREDPSALSAVPLLALLGRPALERMADLVGDDRGAALYVLVSDDVRDPIALPVLASIATDTERDRTVRERALDALVRVRGGDRVETLRGVALQLDDEALRDRARLLFWNHL